MAYTNIDPDRRCTVCGGPITPNNKTQICTRKRECRSALQSRITGGRTIGSDATPDNSQWLTPIFYELEDEGDELRLDENGQPIEIIDELAISIATAGTRRVPLTVTERKEVIRRMISGGVWSLSDMARHCGTISARIEPLINELGYEVVTTRRPNGTRRTASIRRRVDDDNTQEPATAH